MNYRYQTAQKCLVALCLFMSASSSKAIADIRIAAHNIDFSPAVTSPTADPDYSKVYWPNHDANSIESANLDGTGRQTMVSNASGTGGGAFAFDVDVPHQKIYWFNETANSIQRQNLNGTGRETVVANSGFDYMMILDVADSRLYWANFEGHSIERIKLDGSGRQTIINNIGGVSDGPVAFEVDFLNNKIYWYDPVVTSIKRANLNGSGEEVIVAGIGYLYALNIDKLNQKLYFANYNAKSVERVNLNGTGRETVVSGTTTNPTANSGPLSIALDNVNSKIYWFDEGDNTIKRSNLNNTGKETVTTGSGFAYTMVIPVEAPITLPVTLQSFTAKSSGADILLEWKTNTELGTSAFDIERSLNNEAFTKITTVDANGKGGLYNYFDRQIKSGSIYSYRLKMRDVDNQFEYSPVVRVNTAFKNDGKQFSLYPNPVAADYIYLKSLTGSRSNFNIVITDQSGKVIYKGKVVDPSGVYKIPTSKFVAGAYVMSITDNKNKLIEVLKFVK